MSREEVREAVLAFLDQFIARGAACDLRELRERLATQSDIQERLNRELSSAQVSDRDAFDAMRRFLEVTSTELKS